MKVKSICLVLIFAASAFAWKKEAHFISLPLIEGSGLYTSISLLQQSNQTSTKVPAVATASLLAINATVGAIAMFGPQDNYGTLRLVHRIIGFGLTATGIWMSAAAGNDKSVKNLNRNISYGYTVLTSVPIIIFSF